MEIQGEDSVGMIIHNGTLNGATDYAADGSNPPAYTNEQQTGSVGVDNSSYAGLYVCTNNGVRVDINLTNADAAMSKVTIPTAPSGPAVTITSDSASISEASGSTTVRVRLSATSAQNTTVVVGQDGTANSTGDYTFNTTFFIPAGSTEATTTLTATNDSEVEGTETAILYIDTIAGGNGAYENGVQSTTVSITDDDVPVLGSFSITSISEDFGRLLLNWSTPSGWSSSNDYYRLYYTTVPPGSRIPVNRAVSSSDSVYEPIAGTKTSFIHGGLDASKTYYYRVAAVDTSNGNIITMSDEQSAIPKATECTNTIGFQSDSDSDLLAYYPFEGTLEDKSNANGRGGLGHPYNLSYGGTSNPPVTYGAGCACGSALYLSGYGTDTNTKHDGLFLENTNFSQAGSDISSTNGWTVSLWASADGDMDKFASMFSTGRDNNGNEFQIDVNDAYTPVGEIRMLTSNQRKTAMQMVIGNWYHIVMVWQSGTAELWVNGKYYDSGSFPYSGGGDGNQWDQIKIGLNRNGSTHWKGYIDEVKIYNRKFSSAEIANLYSKSLPPMVDNPISYTRASGTNTLRFPQVVGATSYRIFWAEKSSSLTNVIQFSGANFATTDADIQQITGVTPSCSAGTCSYSHSGLTTNKYYYYRIAAENAQGTGPVNITELRIQAL